MLLFDEEPFDLTPTQVEEYAKEFIFRVGEQFITPNKDYGRDPDASNPFWIASTGVECSYSYSRKMKDKDGKEIVRKGKLTYYDVNMGKENGKLVTTPAWIMITESGHIKVQAQEYLKNFFLHNHPKNEVVKADARHPNHDPSVETNFATYQAEKVDDKKMKGHEALLKVMVELQERDEKSHYKMGHYSLKALAATFAEEANANGLMAGEIAAYDELPEKTLRERLLTVGQRYPQMMVDCMSLSKTDFRKEIERFKAINILILNGDEWVFQKSKTVKESIMKVPQKADAIASLVVFFSDLDQNGTKYKSLKNRADAYDKEVEDKAKVALANTE